MSNHNKKCRFCGSLRVYPWTDKPRIYIKCFDYNFISVDPLPSQQELDDHYLLYHDKNHQAIAEKNDLRLQSYHQEINWLCNYIDLKKYSRERPLCIFDYGCSGGYFLDILKEKLNDIPLLLKGDDKSNPAIKILKEKNYYIGLSDIIVKNLSFDIVILRGVIEHVPDFRCLFQSLSQILTKGGYLFITATPNGSSPCATLYRHNWVQHHYPSHIQHFSSHHLDYLAALNKITRVDSIDLYSDSPYRKDTDIQIFVDSIQKGSVNYPNYDKDNLNLLKHAFFESMLTILYKRLS